MLQLPMAPLDAERWRSWCATGGVRSVGRGAARARRRALGRQSVLRGGDRPVAARHRPPGRAARRLRAGDADRRGRGAGHGAGAARGSHRPSGRAREATPLHRRRDRQGVPAAAARDGARHARRRRRRRDRGPARRRARARARRLPGGGVRLQASADARGGPGRAAHHGAARTAQSGGGSDRGADPERLDEHAGLLAHHWTEAGDALRASGWHVRAARWVVPGI